MFPIFLFLLLKSSFSIFDEESATLTIKSENDFDKDYSSSSNILYLYVNNVEEIPSSSFFYFSTILYVKIGDSVKTIGSRAFSACGSLQTIIFGNSVETIESNAFSNCVELRSISLPDSLLTIGDQAFTVCTSITSINIPTNVNTIGTNPFTNCGMLKSITVSDGSENYEVYNYFLYDIKTNTIISYPPGQTQRSITIPNSIKTIGPSAFSACDSIQTLNIGSVQTIESQAFLRCISLQTLNLGSVQTIGAMAFSSCYSLNEIFYYGDNEPDIQTMSFNGLRDTIKVYVLKNYSSDTFGDFLVEKILQPPQSKTIYHTYKYKQNLKQFSFLNY